MKKLFLFVAVAAICFSCGNKQEATEETLVDSTAVEAVVDEPAAPAAQPVAEKQESAPAKANNVATPLKENLKQTVNEVGNKAIDKAGEVATEKIENSDQQELQTKKRR